MYMILVYFNTCQVSIIIIIPAKRLPLLDKLTESRGICILRVPATLCAMCPDISSVCLYNIKSYLFQMHRSQPLQFRAARRLPPRQRVGAGGGLHQIRLLWRYVLLIPPGIITKGFLTSDFLTSIEYEEHAQWSDARLCERWGGVEEDASLMCGN